MTDTITIMFLLSLIGFFGPLLILGILKLTKRNLDNHPKATPLKRNTFSNRFNNRQNDYGFTLSKSAQSVSTISDLEFNLRALNSGYFRYPITIPKATKYRRIEFDNKISDKEIDEFIFKLKGFKVGNYDNLSYKEKLILYHLIGLMNDDAIAYYQTFVSNTVEAK